MTRRISVPRPREYPSRRPRSAGWCEASSRSGATYPSGPSRRVVGTTGPSTSATTCRCASPPPPSTPRRSRRSSDGSRPSRTGCRSRSRPLAAVRRARTIRIRGRSTAGSTAAPPPPSDRRAGHLRHRRARRSSSALQAVDPTGGPRPGLHNWFRGGTLADLRRQHPQRPAGPGGPHRCRPGRSGLGRRAPSAPWDGVDRWFHGDVAGGNLLLDDAGQLAAVIDFGTCGVGDPACDLAVAWTLLTSDGRQAFRDRLAVDAAAWTRGRGWALWKAVATCRSTVERPRTPRRVRRGEGRIERPDRRAAAIRSADGGSGAEAARRAGARAGVRP